MKNLFFKLSTGKWVLIAIACFFLFAIVKKAFKAVLAFFGIKDTDNTTDKEVLDKLSYNKNNLTKQAFFYENLAKALFDRMSEFYYVGLPQSSELEKLNVDELKHIVAVFGIRKREGTYLGIGSYSGNLFRWFEEEFGGVVAYATRSRLKKIFAPTGLW